MRILTVLIDQKCCVHKCMHLWFVAYRWIYGQYMKFPCFRMIDRNVFIKTIPYCKGYINKQKRISHTTWRGGKGGVKCATISFFLEEIIKETQTLICIKIVYFLDVTVHFLSINQTRLIHKKNKNKTIVVLYTGSINIEQCSLLAESYFHLF